MEGIKADDGAEDLSGFKSSEVVGSHCFDNILQHIDLEGNPLCKLGCPLSNTITNDEITQIEVFLQKS